MENEFEIQGYLIPDKELSEDKITDLFIEYIELNNWLFGGGIHPIGSNKKFTVAICVIVDESTSDEYFKQNFNNFLKSSKWEFHGKVLEINDGYYINQDGTRGKHVSDD